ncbi:MAG: dephospho-CoA kinase [Acidobacteria bacterium]|nr:dephospho-CoA kinase [Acidobacteriota bacterium]
MRIAILGNSGSGKSTLARWFAARSGATLLDLDTVAWEPGQIAVPRAAQDAEAEVVSFCLKHPDWVIEDAMRTLSLRPLRLSLIFCS